ncbi:hypothetical protein [uncultured Treponema sp.]|uniref:NACHT domain-containing protein n=1 Tax=uncultured Treponema sp. TaxID=162155 RepID=UPI0025982E1D|nr:hypothetical protein [uncultured Treponema sp.]
MANELLFLIKEALSSLNKERGGDRDFENLCEKLIVRCIDSGFIPSSGSDNGGDGGIDGWSIFGEGETIKYAFSIDKKTKKKIISEIEKSNYENIRFFTNQQIKQSVQEDIKKQYPQKKIDFYDQDAIAEIIERYEDLGKYIGLKDVQHNLDIAYIKEHNQFQNRQNELHLIQRSISFTNNKGETETIVLTEYIKDCPNFVILYAQAGYGKTESLKTIYKYVLENDFPGRLPPLFMSLSNYNGNNFSDLLRNAQSSFHIQDCLLLLDGYDEMDYRFRESFFKELKSYVLSNSSVVRKVILSCRTNYMEKTFFLDFNPVEIYLSPLTDENVVDYVNSTIEKSKQQELLNNTFFNNFKYNIFYLIRITEYYKEQGHIVESIPSLFRFISKRDICLLKRTKDVSNQEIEKYETLALYMIMNQKITIDDESILKDFNLDFFQNDSFSHKSIMEFLAAEKICKQNDLNVIKQILFSNQRVVPYLLDVFGFVLNILLNSESQYRLFEELLEYQLTMRNTFSLLKIEADKISPEMNSIIVKSIIENSNKMLNFRAYEDDIAKFLMSCNVKNNLNIVITEVENYKEKKRVFAPHLVLKLALHYESEINESFQERLYQLLKNILIENEDIDFIKSMFISVSNLSVCKKHKEDYELMSEKIINLGYREKSFYDVVDWLASYIQSCEKEITPEQYYEIFKLLIHILSLEDSKEAEFVSNQIERNDISITHHFIFYLSFINFSKEYFKKYPEFFWKVLAFIIKEQSIKLDYDSQLNDFFGIFSKKITTEIIDNNLSNEKYNIVLALLINSPSAFDNHFLWNEFNKSLPFRIGIKIVKEILIKTNANYMHYHFLINYSSLAIKTKDDFDLFYKSFYSQDTNVLLYFYTDYCLRINDKEQLYDYVYTKMDEKIKQDREKYKTQAKKYSFNFADLHLTKAKEDYHIIFDVERLKSEIDKLFDTIGKNNIILKEQFFEYTKDDYENPKDPLVNEFIEYWFRSIFRNSDEINKEQIFDLFIMDRWNYNFAIHLILFMNSYSIQFNDLNEEEIRRIKDWVVFILDTYPLNDVNKKLLQVHRFLSYVLRQTDFLSSSKNYDFCSKYSSKLYGLIFSGFSSVIDGMWQYDYSYYELDYLEKYLSKKNIIDFILNNLNNSKLKFDIALSVYGYLVENKNILSVPQKNYICKSITDFIITNLKENHPAKLIDYAYEMGFKLTQISASILEEAIILSENKDSLVSNYAYSLLFENHFIDPDERGYIIKILEHKFYSSTDVIFKKILAEIEISMNKSANDIFVYYIDYLLNEEREPKISQFFFHSNMCTEQIEHLGKIEEIFDYIKDKDLGFENQFNYFLNNIVMNSYRAMAKKVSVFDFSKIIGSIEKCIDKIPYYETLLDEINNDFSKSNYVPFNIEQVKLLK